MGRILSRKYQVVADAEIRISDCGDFDAQQVRLIVNETKKQVLVSSLHKDNIASITRNAAGDYTIKLDSAFSIASTDVLTIEIWQPESSGSSSSGSGSAALTSTQAEEIEFTAKALGYTGDMPGYAELTETECGTMVDTLAGQMMHADEDGEVDYLYALQMGYPDHTFTAAELASIKAARDEYWEEHPIE